MPRIYLSPSLQEFNLYTGGGNEALYMRQVAAAMIPYLRANGIQFTISSPGMTLTQVIAQSNSSTYDLHLALHSNAAPPGTAGTVQGTEVYYYPTSTRGRRFAEILAANMRNIYIQPANVRVIPNANMAELRRTKAPAVLLETAYHDNATDAQWIRDNIELIAKTIVVALTQYFGIPFVESSAARIGTVVTMGGNLNIRSQPNTLSSVVTRAPNGAQLIVYSTVGDWYLVGYCNETGYAFSRYVLV